MSASELCYGFAPMSTEAEQKTTGCGGLLLIPLSTVAVGVQLLVFRRTSRGKRIEPYRSAAREEGEARPLKPLGMRVMGLIFLFWTLLLPGAVVARGAMVYRGNPVPLVLTAGLGWVAMFIGHLVSVKIFRVLEPRLPHEE